MANLCAPPPFPVTVPPAPVPAPSRLRAGPLPGGRTARPPSQWGVGEGRAGGGDQGGWEKGETPWSSTEGGGTVPSGAPRLLTGGHSSQAGKQLSFTLARREPQPLTGTLGRGRDLAFSPSPSVFLLSGAPSLVLLSPPPSTLPSLLEGCLCRVLRELGYLEERVVEWNSERF